MALEQLDWLGTSGAPDRDADVQFAACPAPAADQTCVYVEYQYPWAADPIISPLFSVGIPDTITGTAIMTWEGL